MLFYRYKRLFVVNKLFVCKCDRIAVVKHFLEIRENLYAVYEGAVSRILIKKICYTVANNEFSVNLIHTIVVNAIFISGAAADLERSAVDSDSFISGKSKLE